MARQKTSPHDYPQAEQKHPDTYEADLNPDRMAGQNIGEHAAADAPHAFYAADVKQVVNTLHDEFTWDELREIVVLGEGARLQQGRTYLDLRDRRTLTATGDQEVGAGEWYVPKHETPYPYWNRLLGMTSPQRTT